MILKQNTEAEISVESVLLALLSDDFCLIPQVPGPAGVAEFLPPPALPSSSIK
jgi:hypothetical protein